MSSHASPTGLLERLFHLSHHQTTVRTEVLAGLTTFATMAYILIVNPLILKDAGMDFGAVFTATALSALIATLVMAFAANLPFALAPGMGLNAFFAYAVVLGMGHTWQFALTAVFIEGVIFLILVFFNIREAILNSLPATLKKAVSVGIGLFIAFIGLVNAEIVTKPEAAKLLVQLGDITHGNALLALLGILITSWLLAKSVRGALLIGIIASTLLGIPLGVTQLPEHFSVISTPPAPALFQFEFSSIFTLDMLVVLITFLFVDLFDTVGTLVGVSTKAGLLDDDGRLPQAKPALLADAIGTTAGACLGTSTVTTYVESAAGVAEGGRTGLTALSTGIMFALALLFSPLFTLIPSAATAPALVLVGLFMMSPIVEIDFTDMTEAIPAFLAIIIMPLTYSIAEGIVFGVVSYTLLKLLTGQGKAVHSITYLIAGLFILRAFL